jgi:uncharacterized protein
MRVVLDANVLISAVIQAGPSYRIVSRWLDDASLDVVICPAVLAEVEEVLRRPRLQKHIEPELTDLYLATVRRIAHLVDDPVSIATATRDPNDDYLIALARHHDADYIVTGDKDLLEWDDQVPPAITPAAFEDLLSAL